VLPYSFLSASYSHTLALSHEINKLIPSVVFWGSDGVAKDVERIQEFVSKEKARVAYAVFIDEDGYFSHRSPHLGSKWIHWDTKDASSHHVSVLWSKVSNPGV
jgi:hypothetical protein